MRGTSWSFLACCLLLFSCRDGLTGNPTVVLLGPPLPLDQHLPFLTLKYLFYAKQSVVRQLHLLQIGVVKGAFHRGSIPLVYLVSGNGTGYHVMHHKHFLGPPWQIAFLEGTVHFVETHTILHLKLRAGGFLFQPFAVQMFPHGFLIAPRHVLGSHANGPMTGGIVSFHESRQFLEELKGVDRREIPIESFFQGSIEPFHQSRFGIPVHREMMDPMFFGPLFERAVIEFFASIRLQSIGATPLAKGLVKGLDHGHPGLGFQRLDPRVLGQNIDHGHQVPHPAVVLGQGLHFHQIDNPLIVQPAHNHGQSGKTASSGFVQGVSQILFQDSLRFFKGSL